MAKVVSFLYNLGWDAGEATYPAQNMREDLAKAWANGENHVEKRVLEAGEITHTWAEEQAYDMAGKGLGVERAVKGFERCLNDLRHLVTQLDQTPTADEASEIWGAYDKVGSTFEGRDSELIERQNLDKYWDFIRALTSKLKDAGIRRYLGRIFRALFEGHIRAFQVSQTYPCNGVPSC